MSAGRGVIVTGGVSGLGAAMVERLRADGLSVGVIDRQRDGVAALEAEGVPAVAADVADSEALTAAVHQLAERLGGLSGLVNNAGIGNLKRLVQYTDAEFDLLVRVNLYGTFFGIRAAAPLLAAGGGGSIVNMASVSGVRPTRGEGPYSAAKAAVVSLTMSAALELGPDIRVNCVSPGFIVSPLNSFLLDEPATRDALERATPAGRMGEAADVASVVAFLLSDQSAYVTGQNLVIDGGSALPNHQVDPLLRSMLGG